MIPGSAHRGQQVDSGEGLSRIDQDLATFHQQFATSNTSDNMLRKIATQWTTRRQPHVCVVGTGVAGLRCAEVLIQHGVKVTMYEARQRIGGRIYQTNLNNHIVDLGPNWIHGTDHNPILDLAKETKSVACSVGEGSATFNEKGELMEESRSDKLSELVWGIIADAFEYSNRTRNISPNRSLKDYFVEKLSNKNLSQDDKKTMLQMSEIWGGFIGGHVEHQSLRYLWLEECIDGENLFLSSTYKAILNRIAEAALKDADVVLSTQVSSIESGAPSEQKVTITTSEGGAESFDAVVLTVPLGLLKRSIPALKPDLPSRMSSAIENISYGRLEKAFVSFDVAFWDRSGGIPTAKDSETSNPVFRRFLHPLYASSNPHSHDIGMMSLNSLPGGIRHPTLLFYIHGDFATEMVDLLAPHEPGSESYDSALEALLSPYYSRLPNYDPKLSECKPRAFYATAWQRDEYAGFGSYTNFQIPNPPVEEGSPDYPHLDKDIETLRHGLPERGLWLAGEHTAPFIALGTVTGAYWSGDAVAKRIVAWFEGKDPEKKDPPSGVPGGVDNKASTVQVGKGGKESVTGMEIP